MSSEGSLKLRKRDRFRQWLPSQHRSNTPSNASTSSANEGGGASTPPGSVVPAQPAGQGPKDDLKLRKRDRFLGLFGRSSSDRPPTPKPFKRTTLDNDLAALSTTYLMDDCHNVRALILAIVTLSANCNNEKSSLFVGRCADFCLCLIQYVDEDSSSAVNAVDEFLRAIKEVHSFDYSIAESLKNAEERVDQSIRAIKASHPSLGEIKGRPRRGLSRTVVTVLDVGIPVITVLKDAVEIIGAVPFLKPVLGAVVVMSQAARQTQSNFDGMVSLSTTAGEFALSIAERCSTFQVLPPNLDNAVKNLESRLQDIASRCREMSNKTFISCFFQATAFKDELDELKQRLDIAIQEFQSASLMNLQDVMQHIAEKIEWLTLDGLPMHPDMSGKLAEYLFESRTPNVKDICKWIESSSELLLCIHGTAGVGKSTLAGHLSKELRASGRLAGSVFLGTFPTDTSGPETIIRMLAREIGNIHPRAIPKILEAMRECHGASLDQYLQKYILEPLRSLNHPHPLVIVVDALDEWRDHPTFIPSLAYLNSNASVVKVIATSRLNPVACYLPNIEQVSVHTYHLTPVSPEVIKAYFKKHLQSVPWVDGRKAHPGDIDKLAELSGGLPIWAATVIALVSYQFSESPPHDVLADIVGSRRQVGGSDGLGDLYENALKRLFTTAETQQQFRRYFGAIIALQAPLSISDFSALTGISMHLINKIQAALPALHTRPPPLGSEKTVHPATAIFHLSLIEHVEATGAETSFAISVFESHSALGLRCLEHLSSLPSLSPHHDYRLRAIQDYAVRYSPYHVSNGTPRSNDNWSQTEHCGILRAMSAGTQRQWAALFHKALMPEDDELELETEDGMGRIFVKLAERLGRSGGEQWGFQVACLEVAVRIDNGDAEAWSELGWCYEYRGRRIGGIQMHEKALAAFRSALQLRPESHPNHADSLNHVALALWSCYQLNGNQGTLSEMSSCSRKALTLCPAHHPDRGKYLNTLALALNDLYDHNGDLQTLKEVISLHRQGLELRPAPHPERSITLNNLARAFQSLHGHNDGDIDALKEAISLHSEALALRPAPHPYRSSSLNNLANALDDLYSSNGDEKALNGAISLYHEALALEPAPHPGRSMTLNSLAFSLEARYQCIGNISTLNECVLLRREALGLCPAPHPRRPWSLNHLADALLLQFEQNREVGVLDEAASLRRELLLLIAPGHRYRGGSLEHLVQVLEKRLEVTGDDRDRGEIDDVKAELAALQLSQRR